MGQGEQDELPYFYTEGTDTILETPAEHRALLKKRRLEEREKEREQRRRQQEAWQVEQQTRERERERREQKQHERDEERLVRERLQARFNQHLFWMQILTVSLTCVSIGIASYLIHFTRQSTDAAIKANSLASDSREQTYAATRAWLNASVIMQKPTQEKNLAPVAVFSNEGHSPVIAVANIESGFSDVDLPTPDSLLFEQLSLEHPLPTQSLMRIPDYKAHIRLPYYSDMRKTYHPELTANAPIRDSNEVHRRWRTQVFYAWGDVLYLDAFHKKHLLTFCFEHAPGDADTDMVGCPFLNTIGTDIPDNAEYVTPTAHGWYQGFKRDPPPFS